MKIKREDLGLYFALGLTGAGIGLLIGAFIASRRGPHFQEEDWDEGVDISVQKIPPKKFSAKKVKNKIDPDLEAFIEEYEPTAIQIEMVKKGLTTLDDLKETLIKEEVAKRRKPYNYSAQYFEEGDKPELADLTKLPEEEDIIDDRYMIMQDPPKEKSAKNMRVVYYDMEDGRFYTMTRRKQPIAATSVEEFISKEAWETMLPYMVAGFAPLYVDDLNTAKFYRFEIVPEDLEEFSEDDESYE